MRVLWTLYTGDADQYYWVWSGETDRWDMVIHWLCTMTPEGGRRKVVRREVEQCSETSRTGDSD